MKKTLPYFAGETSMWFFHASLRHHFGAFETYMLPNRLKKNFLKILNLFFHFALEKY